MLLARRNGELRHQKTRRQRRRIRKNDCAPLMATTMTVTRPGVLGVEAPLIYERRDTLSRDVVEPTTNEGKTDGRQILDRRREIQLAEEPWPHRVLIGRSDVEQMRVSQRADVLTDDLVRNGSCGLHDMSRAREAHDHN
jgi:hypothetical protein